jgi:hypothetical protein
MTITIHKLSINTHVVTKNEPWRFWAYLPVIIHWRSKLVSFNALHFFLYRTKDGGFKELEVTDDRKISRDHKKWLNLTSKSKDTKSQMSSKN